MGWRNLFSSYAVVSVFGSESSSCLSGGCAIVITIGKKKVLVVCLAGARSLLRPEKKSSSRLSGGCAIVITTGKKKL